MCVYILVCLFRLEMNINGHVTCAWSLKQNIVRIGMRWLWLHFCVHGDLMLSLNAIDSEIRLIMLLWIKLVIKTVMNESIAVVIGHVNPTFPLSLSTGAQHSHCSFVYRQSCCPKPKPWTNCIWFGASVIIKRHIIRQFMTGRKLLAEIYREARK